jgi:hypothetical protein
MNRGEAGVRYSLCNRGVLILLHGREEIHNETCSSIGRGIERGRRGASINERRVLIHDQYRQQRGAQEVPHTSVMPQRRRLIFRSLEIFRIRDSTVSPFGPLSAFCFASQAQFEGDNWTLLYSTEPSTSETTEARIASYRHEEWGESKSQSRAEKSSSIDEATYLAGFDSRHGRIVVDNGEVVFDLLLPSERNPIHIRSLNVVIAHLLVFSNPSIKRSLLKSNRGVDRVIRSAIESVIVRLGLTFKGFGVHELFVPVQIDTRLFGVGTDGGGQPVHSGSVTPLGAVEVRVGYSIVDAGGVTYMRWESAPRCKRE